MAAKHTVQDKNLAGHQIAIKMKKGIKQFMKKWKWNNNVEDKRKLKRTELLQMECQDSERNAHIGRLQKSTKLWESIAQKGGKKHVIKQSSYHWVAIVLKRMCTHVRY